MKERKSKTREKDQMKKKWISKTFQFHHISISSFHLQFSQQFSQQKYPYVLKAGHCHGGTATARIDNPSSLQDAAGLLSGSGLAETQCYCTLEPFIDAKFDVHVQKIGNNYKAFM